MQINFSEFANEAFNVNAKLMNKSVELGVETAQQMIQGTSDQTGEWLKIKNFDDFVETQENWNAFAVGQIQNSTRSAVELGTEAYNSYLNLWKKFSEAAVQKQAVAVAKKPAADKNG